MSDIFPMRVVADPPACSAKLPACSRGITSGARLGTRVGEQLRRPGGRAEEHRECTPVGLHFVQKWTRQLLLPTGRHQVIKPEALTDFGVDGGRNGDVERSKPLIEEVEPYPGHHRTTSADAGVEEYGSERGRSAVIADHRGPRLAGWEDCLEILTEMVPTAATAVLHELDALGWRPAHVSLVQGIREIGIVGSAAAITNAYHAEGVRQRDPSITRNQFR
jgi:hypothetical protein